MGDRQKQESNDRSSDGGGYVMPGRSDLTLWDLLVMVGWAGRADLVRAVEAADWIVEQRRLRRIGNSRG